MKTVTLEEALRQCLENPENLGAEQLLAKFPQHRAELEPVLRVESALKEWSLHMPEASRAAVKERVIAAATANSRGAAHGRQAPRELPTSHERSRMWPLRRAAWVAAATLLVVALVWYSSASALADSPLYNVKLLAENGLVSLNNTPAGLVKSHIELANTRLYDLRAMQATGKLHEAQTAFDNYSFHLKEGVGAWKALGAGEYTVLDKLLYLSSVAGRSSFAGFGSPDGGVPLPSSIQAAITQAIADINTLNTQAAQELQAAGIDPASVLREADTQLGALLTPIPGITLPTPTPATTAIAAATLTPGPTATGVPTATPVPCLDEYEPNGTPQGAKPLEVGELQVHIFCPAPDTDWLVFAGEAGKGYEIEAVQLAPGANAYLYLFGPDASTLLNQSNPPGGGATPPVLFYPQSDGQYYIQIRNVGDGGGPGTRYSISVTPADSLTGAPTEVAVPTQAP